jgi:hypothetical protein
MTEEFAKGILNNIIPPANIIVYIKEARTLKKAVKYIYELIIKVKIAIK